MLLIVIFIVFVSSNVNCAENRFRLSNDTEPVNYDLSIAIDVESAKFAGDVRILLKVSENTNLISLNFKDIAIDMLNMTLIDENGTIVKRQGSPMPDYEAEMLHTNFDTIHKGKQYTLSASFTGDIRDDLKGLYLSSYYKNGERRYIATTFFAAAYARMVFPCYDEPRFKATFNVKIYHMAKYHALSNMGAINDGKPSDKDGLLLTTFHETPIMSTYLLALIVSDFTSITVPSDYTYSSYAQEKVIHSTQYALNFTESAVNFLEIYFKRPYQLEKLDLIAIDDFLMGAMENWGLLTFKSSAILNEGNRTTTINLQKTTKILIHELIHQWFGNEVTCDWWSYIWLNEGFTAFYENYVLSLYHPEWRLVEQFVVNDLHATMLRDFDENVKPMTKPIETPTEISLIYDFVAYPKAASVIRMMQAIVTTDVFDKFTVMYLEDRSYNTSTENDVFRVMQEAVDLYSTQNLPPIKTVMHSWTNNPGFPLVTITREYTSSIIEIRQERFVSFLKSNDSLFYIPLNFATSSFPKFTNTSAHFWLDGISPDKNIQILELANNDWIIFNLQQTGYYRVNYDDRNWKLIADELRRNHTVIHPLNRAQLIDDSFNLMKSGYVNVEILMEILHYLRLEKDLIPLRAGFRVLLFLDQMMEESDTYLTYQSEILEEIFQNMQANNKSDHFSILYKAEVSAVACKLMERQCLHESMQYFESSFDLLSVDFRAPMFCGVNRQNDSLLWPYIFNRFQVLANNLELKRENLEEFEDIGYALGCVLTEEKYLTFLQETIETNLLDATERVKIFSHVLGSSYLGAKTGLEFIENHFEQITTIFVNMEELIAVIKNFIISEELLEIMKRIHNKTEDEHIQQLIEYVIEVANDSIEWREKHLVLIPKWIDKQNSAVTITVAIRTLVTCIVTLLLTLK